MQRPELVVSRSHRFGARPAGAAPRHGEFDYLKNPKNLEIEKFAVITLKFEQSGLTIEQCVQQMQTKWQALFRVCSVCTDLSPKTFKR